MGLFDRFKKQEGPADLDVLQAKNDWAGLARAYFSIGKDALDKGDPDRARLWLGRCQALTDSSDSIYGAVGGRIIGQCSDLLCQLEDAPLLGNRVVERIEDEFSTLDGTGKRLWGLLTLCRLERLLSAAGSLPGCEMLEHTGEVIDALLTHVYGEVDSDAWETLEEYNDFFTEFGETPAYYDLRQQLPVPAGSPFQLLDFNGEILPTELNLYLDVIVNGDLSPAEMEGLAPRAVLDALDLNDQSGLIRCALLSDYWLRTREGKLEDISQVKAEEERIWDDLSFLRGNPDEASVRSRARQYRQLELFQ